MRKLRSVQVVRTHRRAVCRTAALSKRDEASKERDRAYQTRRDGGNSDLQVPGRSRVTGNKTKELDQDGASNENARRSTKSIEGPRSQPQHRQKPADLAHSSS